MTDNEIFKALECCSTRGYCNKCSRYTIPYPTCKEQLCEDVCCLINLQQAEIKTKEENIQFLQGKIGALLAIVQTDKKEFDKLNAKFKNVTECQQNNCKECQYYKEHQEYECLPYDIGVTAYCVNGYGSNRYIEKFTVDKIVISNEGIVLIDPNGAEWLARVCHFSLESAERELKAKKELVNIINENSDKEDIIIHLTYELDKAPQSEEVRKDIENYIRHLKEQRSNNNV